MVSDTGVCPVPGSQSASSHHDDMAVPVRCLDTVQLRPQHQQRLHIRPLRKPFITLYNQHFIEVYHFIF